MPTCDNRSCPLATQLIITSINWCVNSKTVLLAAPLSRRQSFLQQHCFVHGSQLSTH
ncbi:unnamed protein product [Hymenolepis diminuta]|uniref:Uncharacterized protein n=1 Tax=Hymenolepis diminuta TaxID=6216 RepID=A0A564Y6P9_HYMDI|nr:unnamed protein product [Hymenolepis diminuta]